MEKITKKKDLLLQCIYVKLLCSHLIYKIIIIQLPVSSQFLMIGIENETPMIKQQNVKDN